MMPYVMKKKSLFIPIFIRLVMYLERIFIRPVFLFF